MKVDLEQLENNEAILLMYFSGELSPQDRAEVDQMLSCDSGLRTELESLYAAIDFSDQALRDFDLLSRPAVPDALARRQVARLVADWMEKRQQPVLVYGDRRPRQTIPWRIITYAMAASMLVGVYLWAGYRTSPMRIDPKDHPFANSIDHRDYPPDSEEADARWYSEEADVHLSSSPPKQPESISSAEKLDLLANSLDDSASDESSNMRVAEVAAAIPMGTQLDSMPDNDRSAKNHDLEEP